MADPIYTNETVTVYFEMWDGEISPEKPTTRPDAAWLTDAQVSEITLTVVKPNQTTETKKLTSVPAGVTKARDGEWRARFETDGGPGTYHATFEGLAADGYKAVSSVKVKVKPRP